VERSAADPSGILGEDLLETPVSRPLERPSARSLRRSRSRRKNRSDWIAVPVAFALIAGAALLFALVPELSTTVLGYFISSPTPTTSITEIASQQASATAAIPIMQATETLPEITEAAATLSSATEAPQETPLPQTPEVTSAPTATPRGGGSGQIAFASDKIGVMQVWLLDIANPRNQRRITDSKDGACQPAWSPDGLKLAFISPCSGRSDTYKGANIYTINVDALGNPDTDSVKQITSSLEGDFDPAWSPDGKRIAYTSLSNGKTAIYVIELDDMTITEISRSRFPDKQPAWNPRSMQLAFVRQAPHSQIWYMTDNGSPQNQFTFSGAVNNLWPAWSVDGQILFFSQASPDAGSVPVLIYRRYEDRGNAVETRILTDPTTTGPIVEVDPSPDGFWLAYESWPDGKNHDIYMMSINGSNQTRLTTDPGVDFGAAFRPPVRLP
jgi:Tol biopolymer transport system component